MEAWSSGGLTSCWIDGPTMWDTARSEGLGEPEQSEELSHRGWPWQPIRRMDHLGSGRLEFELWVYAVTGLAV